MAPPDILHFQSDNGCTTSFTHTVTTETTNFFHNDNGPPKANNGPTMHHQCAVKEPASLAPPKAPSSKCKSICSSTAPLSKTHCPSKAQTTLLLPSAAHCGRSNCPSKAPASRGLRSKVQVNSYASKTLPSNQPGNLYGYGQGPPPSTRSMHTQSSSHLPSAAPSSFRSNVHQSYCPSSMRSNSAVVTHSYRSHRN